MIHVLALLLYSIPRPSVKGRMLTVKKMLEVCKKKEPKKKTVSYSLQDVDEV
jgi:hypothetical protein